MSLQHLGVAKSFNSIYRWINHGIALEPSASLLKHLTCLYPWRSPWQITVLNPPIPAKASRTQLGASSFHDLSMKEQICVGSKYHGNPFRLPWKGLLDEKTFFAPLRVWKARESTRLRRSLEHQLEDPSKVSMISTSDTCYVRQSSRMRSTWWSSRSLNTHCPLGSAHLREG